MSSASPPDIPGDVESLWLVCLWEGFKVGAHPVPFRRGQTFHFHSFLLRCFLYGHRTLRVLAATGTGGRPGGRASWVDASGRPSSRRRSRGGLRDVGHVSLPAHDTKTPLTFFWRQWIWVYRSPPDSAPNASVSSSNSPNGVCWYI